MKISIFVLFFGLSSYMIPSLTLKKCEDNDTFFHIPRQRRWLEGFAEQCSQTHIPDGIEELMMAIVTWQKRISSFYSDWSSCSVIKENFPPSFPINYVNQPIPCPLVINFWGAFEVPIWDYSICQLPGNVWASLFKKEIPCTGISNISQCHVPRGNFFGSGQVFPEVWMSCEKIGEWSMNDFLMQLQCIARKYYALCCYPCKIFS